MIITIPLQIDDEIINGLIAKDYERKIEANLTKMVEDRIMRMAGYGGTKQDGIARIVDRTIGDYIDEKYREEVIERAAKRLEERVARTKAGQKLKEIVE